MIIDTEFNFLVMERKLGAVLVEMGGDMVVELSTFLDWISIGWFPGMITCHDKIKTKN